MSEVEELQKRATAVQQEITDILAKHGFDGFAGVVGCSGYVVTLWMDAPGKPKHFQAIGRELESMVNGNTVSTEEGIYKPRKQ